MNDKVILTNLSALNAKYKKDVSQINAAVKKLIAADKKLGLQTRLIALDDARAMKALKAPPVVKPTDPKQNKMAIDGVYKALAPDYLLILGSIDVIPHQDMRNPVFQPGDDDDQLAEGDLPYACEAPYSRKPEDFVGPTRVVGRLPDLTGASDPAYLVSLLETAANHKSLPPDEYAGYFGLSAAVWEGSTRMSLDNLFGSHEKLNLSPNKGPGWPKSLLNKRLHFINCHGAQANSQFFGQHGDDFPASHDAKLLKNKIVEGTIAAVECCYGAELYDPFLLGDGQMGICSTYLAGKAYGFFGSTTIAYGPADGNGSADLICQSFLKHVLEGSSIGRAALEARQEFISTSPHLDPFDLKTLAQFNLLADPSIRPVNVPSAHNAVDTGKAGSHVTAKSIERTEARQQLHAKGLWLSKNQPVARSTPSAKTSASIEATMKKIAAKVNIEDPSMASFPIEHSAAPKTMMAKAITATAFHVMMGDPSKKKSGKKAKKTSTIIEPKVCVVAKEVNGKIVSFRELHKR